MEPIALSRGALSRLPAPIARPGYDPAAVRPGIVHLGLGGFHRAHMARLTHDLMGLSPGAADWGIVGVGLRPEDRALHAALATQDRLYSLIERHGRGESVTVIGALAGLAGAWNGAAGVLDAIDAPGVRIVSLTVTGAGYGLNPATRTLDPADPVIAHDLAEPEAPRGAVGVVVEGLRRRMIAGRAPFTALSCDNLQSNGEVLRGAVLDFAARRDPRLADWIAAHGRFPSSMVDRITPVTTLADIEGLAARHGLADRAPVVCERFIQWVVEDDFADGRPAWEAVGVQFVADVAPYERMKLRLLNASHLAVAGLGQLCGHAYIHAALADGRIQRFMRALMDRETGRTLAPVPGVDLAAYKATLIERFANPAIRDTVARVNTDAPLSYLLDPIRDRLAAGAGVELLALALAAWMRRVGGADDPLALFAERTLFGDLGQDPRLVAPTTRWLTSLHVIGAVETLARAETELGYA
jgi:mannitol 2-dehydrogenase